MRLFHLYLRTGVSRILPALVLSALVLSAWAPAGVRAAEANLYEATVALADTSEHAQAAALQLAMREVLGRVTGRPDAADEPALSAIMGDARRYVQQYRITPEGRFFVSFDGRELEKRIAAADPSGIRDVAVAVTAINDIAAYAAVTDYLESLRPVRALAVEQLAGDAVTYRLRVSGDIGELARAIELNTRLRPTSDSRSTNLGVDAATVGALSYQYQP